MLATFFAWRFAFRLCASLRDPNGDWTAKLHEFGCEHVAVHYTYESVKLGMRFNFEDKASHLTLAQPFPLRIEGHPARWVRRTLQSLVGENRGAKFRFLTKRLDDGYAERVKLADVDLLDLRRKTHACKHGVYAVKRGRTCEVFFEDAKDAVLFKLGHV